MSLAFERKLYVIRKRVENAVKASDLGQRPMFYIPSLSSKTLIYKGMLNADQLRDVLSRPRRPRRGDGAGHGAFALQHQHVPELGAGPPVSLPMPQRRDQHAARQHQLDARPRDACSRPSCSATTSRSSCRSSTQTGSDSAMFDNALELLVLTGPVAAARRHDDDPGAVERATRR